MPSSLLLEVLFVENAYNISSYPVKSRESEFNVVVETPLNKEKLRRLRATLKSEPEGFTGETPK